MDVLLKAISKGQNVLLTSLYGIERSRFLLRCQLALLSNSDALLVTSKIIHVVSNDRIAKQIRNEAKGMPFEQLDCLVEEYLDGSDTKRGEQPVNERLQICTLKYLLDEDDSLSQSLVIFDGITLENLEGSCCEHLEKNKDKLDPALKVFLPSNQFTKMTSGCRNILLACNPPVDGLEQELGVRFDVVIDALTMALTEQHSSRVSSAVITRSDRLPLVFGGLNPPQLSPDDKQHLYDYTGSLLESSVRKLDGVECPSSGIVVFFPSYGKMVEFHNAWERGKVFERIGLPYGRENRADEYFKNGLIKLSRERRSIFLCSIRYHKEEELAEFVMAQTRMVIIMGLPYAFMNETWEARIKHNNETHQSSPGVLSGTELHKFRAIEFMNGIIKRCLNEYRYKPCDFILVDKALEFNSDKLTAELGLVALAHK